MPTVAARAQTRDATADRFELRLAAAPKSEEHRGGLVAAGDLATDSGAIVGREDAVGHPRPSLDPSHTLHVHADLTESRDSHEEKLVAVRHAEANARGLRHARERRLAVQAESDGDGRWWDREHDTEHLTK